MLLSVHLWFLTDKKTARSDPYCTCTQLTHTTIEDTEILYTVKAEPRERVYLAGSQGCVSFFITLFSRYSSPEQGGGFTSSHIWYNLVQTQNHHPQGAFTVGKWWKPPLPFLSWNLNCFFLIRGCFQRETRGMGLYAGADYNLIL